MQGIPPGGWFCSCQCGQWAYPLIIDDREGRGGMMDDGEGMDGVVRKGVFGLLSDDSIGGGESSLVGSIAELS